MHTSLHKNFTAKEAVSVDKRQQLEIRLALDEFYSMWLPLYERKTKRMREYMAQLRSPEVDFATLMRNTLLYEDNLLWVEEDYELLTKAYPERQRPAWVKKLQRRRD